MLFRIMQAGSRGPPTLEPLVPFMDAIKVILRNCHISSHKTALGRRPKPQTQKGMHHLLCPMLLPSEIASMYEYILIGHLRIRKDFNLCSTMTKYILTAIDIIQLTVAGCLESQGDLVSTLKTL